MNVLIIDDNQILNKLLTKYLVKKGHVVDNVFNGYDGVRQLGTKLFDAIITDYRLPDIDGIDILRMLINKPLKKVLISAYCNNQISEKARQLGAVVVEKPFSNERILEILSFQETLDVCSA